MKVSGVPPASALDQIRRGIMIDRGRLDEVRSGRRDRIITAPVKLELVRGGDNPWYELTLTEGRNRQLRKMFEEIGHHVEKIRRIGYGALRLDVPPGEFRELTLGEVMALGRASKGKKVVPKKTLPEHAQAEGSGKEKAFVWKEKGSGGEVQQHTPTWAVSVPVPCGFRPVSHTRRTRPCASGVPHLAGLPNGPGKGV